MTPCATALANDMQLLCSIIHVHGMKGLHTWISSINYLFPDSELQCQHLKKPLQLTYDSLSYKLTGLWTSFCTVCSTQYTGDMTHHDISLETCVKLNCLFPDCKNIRTNCCWSLPMIVNSERVNIGKESWSVDPGV